MEQMTELRFPDKVLKGSYSPQTRGNRPLANGWNTRPLPMQTTVRQTAVTDVDVTAAWAFARRTACKQV
jgi:hypothetical protein